MLEVIKGQSKKDNSKATSLKTGSHLRLVSSNPDPVKTNSLSSPSSSIADINQDSGTFSAVVQNNNHNNFTLHINDPVHYLRITLALQVHHSCDESESATVSCQYPVMDAQELNNLIWDDETLYGTIMISFQLKILEQLLLFCGEHDAGTLHVLVGEAEAPELEIYNNFTQSRDTVSTLKGKKVRMVMPTCHDTYDRLVDFMAESSLNFNKSLWHDQQANPAIRHYLKTHPLTDYI
jgi:hypothetical protein